MRPPFALASPFSVALAGSPPSSPAAGQEPAPAGLTSAPSQTFPSEVELVTVDVAVVDKRGRAVPGLGKGDFVVTEDGKPRRSRASRRLRFQSARRPGQGAAGRGLRSVSTNLVAEAPVASRTFVVVFDDIHLSPAQALRAKGAVAEFLQSGGGGRRPGRACVRHRAGRRLVERVDDRGPRTSSSPSSNGSTAATSLTARRTG